ncbi:MBL fold metallo-hydrolase [Natronosalvus rutilus]|uniref:Rhodanese-like domain-containing protein n=1 Tax=Natronosalvus rutilus TaxID=2953753 RepID=A0A9E7SW77_9EURY|nr:rhodanese-like domain-containing protein [Natronosalvus rutilus]UTF55225.1 rhodanese-like domain-containing protein [Natronosalvus rutilus]
MVHQITAERLADMIDAGESITLVDTRQEDSYEGWHIRGAENVPFDPDEGFTDEHRARVDEASENGSIVAICGKGLTSTPFGIELEDHGYDDVRVVKGGMEDWSKVYEVVPTDTESEELVIVQVQRRAKGCLGYVVGSSESGRAAVVDPTRQTDRLKVVAEEAGLTIERVLDTHVHADHVSGGRTLADELGVPYHFGERASERDVEYDYEPLADGETIDIGGVEIEALHTPGHTTEMMNYRVDDEAVLTGDTLFVESVGRTELQFGDEDAADGAEMLYDSLHETLLELPEDTRVLPGHVSVSADGRYEVASPGDAVEARLSTLRDELDLLGLEKEAFVSRLVDNTPEKPANYERVIEINTGQATLEDEQEATELEMGPNNCAA